MISVPEHYLNMFFRVFNSIHYEPEVLKISI